LLPIFCNNDIQKSQIANQTAEVYFAPCIILLFYISGELFAMGVVEQYPGGVDVQSVNDSSRYYVIRISEHPTSK
jgi:hypothetical protein